MYPNLPLTSARDSAAAEPVTQDEQLLALMLTTIWATRTGRTLPTVPVGDLSPEELIEFWADDQL